MKPMSSATPSRHYRLPARYIDLKRDRCCPEDRDNPANRPPKKKRLTSDRRVPTHNLREGERSKCILQYLRQHVFRRPAPDHTMHSHIGAARRLHRSQGLVEFSRSNAMTPRESKSCTRPGTVFRAPYVDWRPLEVRRLIRLRYANFPRVDDQSSRSAIAPDMGQVRAPEPPSKELPTDHLLKLTNESSQPLGWYLLAADLDHEFLGLHVSR